jgi:hypothetical protein
MTRPLTRQHPTGRASSTAEFAFSEKYWIVEGVDAADYR